MNAICISLKGNIKCGGKITDVAKPPPPPHKTAKRGSGSLDDDTKSHITNRFQELGMGDPSRNVVEMIFRASCSHSSSKKTIKRVVKVNNPDDVVAKFENYREEAMAAMAVSPEQQHPRIIVDGNELLQFYATTMRCCCSSRRRRRRGGGGSRARAVISQVCRDDGCRVCRIIESGFDTCYSKKHNGIRLSSKISRSMMSEEEVRAVAKSHAKKAVIICRTIAAGGVEYNNNNTNNNNYYYYSTIIVPHPTALLPCFVVLFD